MRVFARIMALGLAASMMMPLPAWAGAGSPSRSTDSVSTATDDVDEETLIQVRKLAAQGAAAYADGRYEDAVEKYLAVHAIAPAPNVLFNVAHIYDRKLNKPEKAKQYYREFIAMDGSLPKPVLKAKGRLKVLEADAPTPVAETPTPVAETPKPVAETPKPVAETPKPVAETPKPVVETPKPDGPIVETPKPVVEPSRVVLPDERNRDDPRWRIGGALLTAVGVGGLVTGIALAVEAGETEDAFAAATAFERRKELQESGRSQALSADILLGIGGAAFVAGLVLLALDWAELTGADADAEGDPTASVGVAPVKGGGAYLSVQGGF